jgi:hypothetical protein
MKLVGLVELVLVSLVAWMMAQRRAKLYGLRTRAVATKDVSVASKGRSLSRRHDGLLHVGTR